MFGRLFQRISQSACVVTFVGLTCRAAEASVYLPLLAQDGETGGTRIVVQGRSFVIEAIIIAVLLGAALFAICRPTHRT